MRHWLIIGAALLVTACQENSVEPVSPTLAPLQAQSVVDKATLTTGEILTFALEIDHVPKIEIEMPEIGAQIVGLRIVDTGTDEIKKRAGRTYHRHWYKLRADLVGSYIHPSVRLQYKEGNTLQEVETSEIFIEVESVLPSDGSAQDIRGLKPIKRPPTKTPWIWIACILALFCVLSVWWWLHKKKRVQEKSSPARPAHEIAYAALDQLRKTNFQDAEALRQYFFAISEIVRKYVEGRFGLNATDLTLEEIKKALRKGQLISPEQRLDLENFLEKTDLIKFTKDQIQESDIELVYESALGFIENTQEIVQEAA